MLVVLGAALLSVTADIRSGAGQTMIEEPWSQNGLAGTFAKPAGGPARRPAVLILAGSGPTDRDGNAPQLGLATNLYRLIASGLAEAGIRSLRYDKRGIGASAKIDEADIRFDRYVTDAVEAVRNLQQRDDVSAVIVAGHSEGGLVAIQATAQIPVAGLAVLAAFGRPAAEGMREQFGTLPWPQATRGEAVRILYALERGERVADIPPELAPLFRPSVQPYLTSFLKIDPATEIARTATPVLLLYAARDLQVSAADRNALNLARLDARVITLLEANHIFKRAPADRAGNAMTYADPNLPLDPGVMPALVDFVRSVEKR
jgi:pimeloyl-ACP methyl ester carboxylesterase